MQDECPKEERLASTATQAPTPSLLNNQCFPIAQGALSPLTEKVGKDLQAGFLAFNPLRLVVVKPDHSQDVYTRLQIILGDLDDEKLLRSGYKQKFFSRLQIRYSDSKAPVVLTLNPWELYVSEDSKLVHYLYCGSKQTQILAFESQENNVDLPSDEFTSTIDSLCSGNQEASDQLIQNFCSLLPTTQVETDRPQGRKMALQPWLSPSGDKQNGESIDKVFRRASLNQDRLKRKKKAIKRLRQCLH